MVVGTRSGSSTAALRPLASGDVVATRQAQIDARFGRSVPRPTERETLGRGTSLEPRKHVELGEKSWRMLGSNAVRNVDNSVPRGTLAKSLCRAVHKLGSIHGESTVPRAVSPESAAPYPVAPPNVRNTQIDVLHRERGSL